MSFITVDFDNETDLQDLITSNSEILNNFIIYDLRKIDLNYNNINDYRHRRYADLLLIEKDYKYWMIVEVEVASHSMKGHIFPQLIELYSIISTNTQIIKKRLIDELDFGGDKKIIELIKRNNPFLGLIVDKIPLNYDKTFQLFEAFCNVITVQRSKDIFEQYIYNVEFYPVNQINKKIAECHLLDTNHLIINHPNLIDLSIDSIINQIIYGDNIFKFNPKLFKLQFYSIAFNYVIHNPNFKLLPGKFFISKNNDKLVLTK